MNLSNLIHCYRLTQLFSSTCVKSPAPTKRPVPDVPTIATSWYIANPIPVQVLTSCLASTLIVMRSCSLLIEYHILYKHVFVFSQSFCSIHDSVRSISAPSSVFLEIVYDTENTMMLSVRL